MSDVICRLKPDTDRHLKIRVDPYELLFDALTYLAADQDRVHRFLHVTGLTPDGIRKGIGEDWLTLGVLDYVLADEALTIGVAAQAECRPEAVMHARDRVAPTLDD